MFCGQMGLNEVEACWNTKKRTPATTPAKQLKHEEDQQISEAEVLIPPIGAVCTSCGPTGAPGGGFSARGRRSLAAAFQLSYKSCRLWQVMIVWQVYERL